MRQSLSLYVGINLFSVSDSLVHDRHLSTTGHTQRFSSGKDMVFNQQVLVRIQHLSCSIKSVGLNGSSSYGSYEAILRKEKH